jgi:phytoene synthase
MIPTPENSIGYLAHHGRTFSFAARLLGPRERARVAAVYAYCRFTDDLVDEAHGASRAELHDRLDQWLGVSREAYDGRVTGASAVDRAMHDMREHGLPFRYAEELIAGMRSDIDAPLFQDLTQLRAYTYRVAGVVGLWMTESFGVRDPWVLERAVALGHAMQLTNIVRDVGDDWRRGRVYLPATLMRSYGLRLSDIDAIYRGTAPVSPAFRAVLEAMMAAADAHYGMGFDAMPDLPPAFRRSVAVAAEVYRGIHAEIRRAGYDTISRRAYTTTARKLVLGARGLGRLRLAAQARASETTIVPARSLLAYRTILR